MKHKNILDTKGCFLDKENKELIIVTEVCEYGTLHDQIKIQRNSGRHFEECTVLTVLGQMIEALAYTHDENTLHCDIKSENILIKTDGSVKLADYGLARLLKQEDAMGVRGTSSYISPEMWLEQHVDGKTDIWSTAITMFELLDLEFPFGERNGKNKKWNICHAEPELLKARVSQPTNNILMRMLQKDTAMRPTAREILAMTQLQHYIGPMDAKKSEALLLGKPVSEKDEIKTEIQNQLVSTTFMSMSYEAWDSDLVKVNPAQAVEQT